MISKTHFQLYHLNVVYLFVFFLGISDTIKHINLIACFSCQVEVTWEPLHLCDHIWVFRLN